MAASILSTLVRGALYGAGIGLGAEVFNEGAVSAHKEKSRGYLFLAAVIAAVAETALAYFAGIPLTLFATAGMTLGLLFGSHDKQPYAGLGGAIMGLALGILHPAVPLVPIVVSAL